MDYGLNKVEQDLNKAFALIKKKDINNLVNHKRGPKLFKKPSKKLDSSGKEKIKISNNNVWDLYLFFYLLQYKNQMGNLYYR